MWQLFVGLYATNQFRKTGGIALFLFPFAMVVIGLTAWGCFESVAWYKTSSQAYPEAAWYAWPGAYWVTTLSEYLFPSTAYQQVEGFSLLAVMANNLTVWPKAIMAAAINTLIAVLPFCAARKVFWKVIGPKDR